MGPFLVVYTLSQYPGWIYTGELPDENRVLNITPCLKVFEFFTSPIILAEPGENIESLIVPSDFLNFIPMSFDITPVILLSTLWVAESCWDHGYSYSVAFSLEY